MKRLAFILFALLLLLAGCGDKDAQKEEKASTQNNKTEKTQDQKDKKSEKDQKEKATTEKENQSEQAADTNHNKDEMNSQQAQQQNNQAQNSGNQATVNTQPSQPHQDNVDKSKIALAFFGNDIDHYSITQSEIMKGVYEYQGPGMTSTRQVNQLTLKRMPDIPNAPQGMKFYNVMPAKGNFATIIGVNDNKVFVGGTQGALVDYQKLLTTGKEMNAQSLYQAHQNDPALTTITNKIQITN